MTVESRDGAAVVSWATGNTIPEGTQFNINFTFGNNPDYIKAYIRDANDNKITLLPDIDYSVAISNSPGDNNVWGVLIINQEITDSVAITIYRNVENSQDIVYTSQTVFAETTEIALDKLTMLIQDQNVYANTIRAPLDENIIGDSLILPPRNARANTFLAFDDDGNIMVESAGEIFSEADLIIDNLETEDPNKALSANQGYILKGKIDNTNTELNENIAKINESISEIDTKVTTKTDELNQSITTLDNKVTTEVEQLNSKIDKKSDPLTAGNNITIEDLVISAVIPPTPVATTTSVGVIQVGDGLSITAEGILSAQGGQQEQSDWNETDPQSPAFIKNKPWPAGYRYVYTLPTTDISNMNALDNTLTTYNNKYYGLSFTRTTLSGSLTISENPQETAELIKQFEVIPFSSQDIPEANNLGIFAISGTQCIYYAGGSIYLDSNIYDKSVNPVDIKQNIEEAAGISISDVYSVGISNDILFINYTSNNVNNSILFCSKDFKNIKIFTDGAINSIFFKPHASVCGNSSKVCAMGSDKIYVYDIVNNVMNRFINNYEISLKSCYADEKYFIYSSESKTIYVKNLEGDFSSWITLDTNKYQQFIGYMHGAYFFKYNNVLRYTYSLESDAYYEIPYNTEIVAEQIITNNDSILLYNGASKCIIPELKPIL